MLFSKKSGGKPISDEEIDWYRERTDFDPESSRYCFAVLYSALDHKPSPRQLRYIGDEAARLISGRDPFFVQSVMHTPGSSGGKINTSLWQRHCSPEGYRALLICGTVHPNGYLREHCLKLLADDKKVLRFVLLRMNDWVPQIRHTAWDILRRQLIQGMPVGDIIQAMPFVEFVRRGMRAQRDEGFSMEELDRVLMEIFAENAGTVMRSPIHLRRLCYRVFMLHPQQDNRELLLSFIRRERDGAQRSALMRFYMNTAERPLSAELVDEFSRDKYWRSRLDACEYRMKVSGYWEGMEELLLSSHYPIRGFAEYYLDKNGFDTLMYCRSHLPDTIHALCDIGSRDDIEIIRPYLESHPCEALAALVRLGAGDSKELVWKAMHSGDAKLEKAAYRLAGSVLRYTRAELLNEIKKESDPHRCWRLISLMMKDADSELLPILIRLVREYSHSRSDIIAMIERLTYYRLGGHYAVLVSQELHDEITEALEDAGNSIPSDLKRYILCTMRVMS